MAYQLGSKKDSVTTPGQTEADFMARFNKNRAAIENYKQMHGGDLEGAYQAVTKEPWPAGRSVKISHGVPEMTADRTTKSVLAKYVAPIGAGALTALTLGGAAPALAGMFGGGGGAAGAGGAATAAGTGGGVVGGGLGTGALGIGATIPGAGATGTIAGGGFGSALAAGAKKIGGAAADKFLGGGQDQGGAEGSGKANWGTVLGDVGESLTSGAASSAAEDQQTNKDRAAWLAAMNADYKTRLDTSVNLPAALNKQAMWSDFAQNELTSNPNAPRTGLLSPAQQAMAAAQKEQILKKLTAANTAPLPTAPEIPTYAQPGRGTKAASTIGTGLTFASKIPWRQLF